MNQLTDKEYRKKNYFKDQFPDGKHFERFTIEPRKGLEDTFNKCNLDIGWALTGGSRKNIKGCPTHYNKCLGAVYCDQEICPFFNKDMRLSYTLEKIKTQICFHCKEALKHRECKVAVKLTLIYDEISNLASCAVKCKGRHSHDKYKRLQCCLS